VRRFGAGTGVGNGVEEAGRAGEPAAGNFVQRPAGDDLVQPGRKRGAVLEPAKVLPGRDQGFLGDVLGIVVVAGQPQLDPVATAEYRCTRSSNASR
jgi:hypothetical protein